MNNSEHQEPVVTSEISGENILPQIKLNFRMQVVEPKGRMILIEEAHFKQLLAFAMYSRVIIENILLASAGGDISAEQDALVNQAVHATILLNNQIFDKQWSDPATN